VIPTLIYCAAGNKRFAEISLRYIKYGAQLPNTIYYPPYFVDQNWKNPRRPQYMAALEQYKPALASVLDWERPEQFNEVMGWAEEAIQHVTDSVIIIPKVVGGIKQLPRQINGKAVRLGYSAASTFSSTPVSLGEFKTWPTHCLGGGIRVQMDVARKADVHSCDGNYIQNMARKWCQFYSPSFKAKHNGWPRLQEAGVIVKHDAPYVAFELTCMALIPAWSGASGQEIWQMQRDWLDKHSVQTLEIQQKLFVVGGNRMNAPDVLLPVHTTHVQERQMPGRKKRTVKVMNIRIDQPTVDALEQLMELHGDQFVTMSDLIRDAILEKAKRDAKLKTKSA
jgi:hypothetical protein